MTTLQKKILGTVLLVLGISSSIFITNESFAGFINGALVGIGFFFIVFAKGKVSNQSE